MVASVLRGYPDINHGPEAREVVRVHDRLGHLSDPATHGGIEATAGLWMASAVRPRAHPKEVLEGRIPGAYAVVETAPRPPLCLIAQEQDAVA